MEANNVNLSQQPQKKQNQLHSAKPFSYIYHQQGEIPRKTRETMRRYSVTEKNEDSCFELDGRSLTVLWEVTTHGLEWREPRPDWGEERVGLEESREIFVTCVWDNDAEEEVTDERVREGVLEVLETQLETQYTRKYSPHNNQHTKGRKRDSHRAI